MIKATELRIGNLIKVTALNDAGIYAVSEIGGWKRIFASQKDKNIHTSKRAEAKNFPEFNDERIVTIQGGARDNEKFIESKLKPLKLTEDLLISLGFQKVENKLTYLNTEIHPPSFLIWFSRDSDDYFQAITSVKYVHQLQNIIFSLIGEEVRFK